MNEENKVGDGEKKYSWWYHLQFNLVMFMLPGTYGIFGTHFFWYYEKEILLPVILVGIANVIYLIWDAINDPLIGYLSDRPTRWSRRYGRRFPYIAIMGIPTAITMMVLFIPPFTDARVNPIPVFLYVVIILIIHETGYTCVSLTRALFPDKFRSDSERRRNAGIGLLIYNIGYLFGFLIPMLIVTPGDIPSYFLGAMILTISNIMTFLIGLPAVREEKEMRERISSIEKVSFLKALKNAVSKKNVRALILVRMANQTLGACIMASIYYFANFILLNPDADIPVILAWFVAGLISIPFWMKMHGKVGNRNLQTMAILAYVFALFPFMFVKTLTGAAIAGFILGFMMGAISFITYPIYSDVVDEATIIDGKRQEGIYQGVLAFFDRFGIIMQPILFTIVHIITEFNPEATIQTPMAQQGIIALMTWIPGAIALITCIIFWLKYDLTKEKLIEIRKQLQELKL
ncbi:MAG: MFS transporter [Promethearchaeota archaeon]